MAKPEQLILGIENSNPVRGPGGFHGEVALAAVGPGGVRALSRELLRPASERDDDVMPAIDRVFHAAGANPKDLGAVAVSVGPGGFTGLRIATVTAKSLAEATGARCLAVPTADALMRRVEAGVRSSRSVAVCLAWKNDTVWCTRYGRGEARGAASLVRLESLFPTGTARSSWLLVAEARLAALLESKSLLTEGSTVLAPRFDALAVIEAAEGLDETDPVAVAPLYPREPEAVTKWRELHPG